MELLRKVIRLFLALHPCWTLMKHGIRVYPSALWNLSTVLETSACSQPKSTRLIKVERNFGWDRPLCILDKPTLRSDMHATGFPILLLQESSQECTRRGITVEVYINEIPRINQAKESIRHVIIAKYRPKISLQSCQFSIHFGIIADRSFDYTWSLLGRFLFLIFLNTI